MRVSTAAVKHLSLHCSQLKPGRRPAGSSGKPEPSSHGASEAFLTQLVPAAEPSPPWVFGPLWLQATPLSCPISGCFMLPLAGWSRCWRRSSSVRRNVSPPQLLLLSPRGCRLVISNRVRLLLYCTGARRCGVPQTPRPKSIAAKRLKCPE